VDIGKILLIPSSLVFKFHKTHEWMSWCGCKWFSTLGWIRRCLICRIIPCRLGAGGLYNTRATYLGSWRPGQQASRHPSKRRCGIVATQESHKESHDEDESNRARWLFPLLLLLCFSHTQFHTYIHDAALII
jgi:hypothetical protein